MLARYRIIRGKRPPSDPLPTGVRQDTRYRTQHCLRPTEAMVTEYLADPTDEARREFQSRYLAELERRFDEDPTPFSKLAELALGEDVFLGCNCPTKKNPSVWHCHTVLSLQFMKRKFPKLDVVMPEGGH